MGRIVCFLGIHKPSANSWKYGGEGGVFDTYESWVWMESLCVRCHANVVRKVSRV